MLFWDLTLRQEYWFLDFIAAIAFVWPANQSRDAKILLRPNEDTTRIWPSSSICKSSSNASSSSTSNATDNDDLILLVVVLSAMKNFRERQAIRESWASDTNVNTKVIFLLGHIGKLERRVIRVELNRFRIRLVSSLKIFESCLK